MAIFKKSIIIILCATLAFSPLLYCGEFSYADSDDSWHDIIDDDMFTAAMATYVKYTRGFNHVVANVMSEDVINRTLTKWNYKLYRSVFEKLGIDPAQAQAKVKYRIMSNGKLQFLYENSGISIFNAMWAKILEEEGLIDSETFNQIVYSGKLFTDTQGNSCLIYIMNINYTTPSVNYRELSDIQQYGTPYKYSYTDLVNMVPNVNDSATPQFIINGYTKTPVTIYHKQTQYFYQNRNLTDYITTNDQYWAYATIPYNVAPVINTNPHFSIFEYANNVYTIGFIHFGFVWNSPNYNNHYQLLMHGETQDIQAQLIQTNVHAKREKFGAGPIDDSKGNDVALDTGKDNVEDIFTDPNYDPTPVDDVPTIPPTDPTQPNPTGGNVDPEDGDVNWHMPDLHVDWDLGDFSNIFPFSIPYDIIELFDIVDADPVTPAIYQEVDFGAFNYTIDFDLSYFDEFMEYVRAMELFLYTLTLFIATRGIFKIY